MGLLQWAYETYEHNAHLAGVPVQGQEPLTPVSHMIQNAQIELTIHSDGHFISALKIPKEENKTIIPVTESSAGRTGSGSNPHPLSDQVQYLAPYSSDKFSAYLSQLQAWAESEYTHPKIRAVLAYVRQGTILTDLANAGIIELEENGLPAGGAIEGIKYEKCLVRWRVLPAPEDLPSACWEDQSLFDRFIMYYKAILQDGPTGICSVTGQIDLMPASHPKGIVSANFGAKLISANDSSGFTYRGRLTDARQSGGVGYDASQKAHSALRWVASNQGVILGGRTFLCWNPGGKPTPRFPFLGFAQEVEAAADPVSYRQQLRQALSGYRPMPGEPDDIVIAALDAATTGRLSVTYYHVLKSSDFLARLERWYSGCCWKFGQWNTASVRSPGMKQIVSCAYGTQQGAFIQADERILKEHTQRLLPCVADCRPIPTDIVRALLARASAPLAYEPGNRAFLLSTACAVIRKYHNDHSETEEWTMALDKGNPNRSYLFGRLLAVAEHVERSTYSREEKREPNAIRMQSVFCQRPMYAWGTIEKALTPYYARLSPGLRSYYKGIVGEIAAKLPPADDPTLNDRLEDVYLLGYYLQREDLSRSHKHDTTDYDREETEYERTE